MLFTAEHLKLRICQCLTVSIFLCLSGCGRTQETETTPAVPSVKTFPVAETTEPLPTETEEMPIESEDLTPVTWQAVYRAYIKKVRAEQPDLEFTLLYVDEDDIPELCFYQGTCVDVYSYRDDSMSYAFRFQTDYYYYGFSYRPYKCMVSSQQGSVMSDGTYTFIEVFERTDDGFIHSGKYGFSDMPHTIDSLKEQGYYTDDEEILEELDVHNDGDKFFGDSWIHYDDWAERSDFSFYEMTDENIDLLLQEE